MLHRRPPFFTALFAAVVIAIAPLSSVPTNVTELSSRESAELIGGALDLYQFCDALGSCTACISGACKKTGSSPITGCGTVSAGSSGCGIGGLIQSMCGLDTWFHDCEEDTTAACGVPMDDIGCLAIAWPNCNGTTCIALGAGPNYDCCNCSNVP